MSTRAQRVVQAFQSEIEELRQENKRLREALEDIADGFGSYPDDLINIAKEALAAQPPTTTTKGKE